MVATSALVVTSPFFVLLSRRQGTVGKTYHYGGGLLSVNPLAVRSASTDVFTTNKRTLTVLHTPLFGDVLYICVGATMVGSIELTAQEVRLTAPFFVLVWGVSLVALAQ